MRPKKDTRRWIYVDTPQGKKRHGWIEATRFIRFIDGDYVRWSDHSFCLNTSAIGQLMAQEVYTLQFRYRMAKQLKIYEIGLSEATRIPPVKNEYGEENIRIPIENCRLTKTVEFNDTY